MSLKNLSTLTVNSVIAIVGNGKKNDVEEGPPKAKALNAYHSARIQMETKLIKGVGLLLTCIGLGAGYYNLTASTHDVKLPKLPVSYATLALTFLAGVLIYLYGAYKAFKEHYFPNNT